MRFKKSLKLRNKLMKREHELSFKWYLTAYNAIKKNPKRGVRTMYSKIAQQTASQVESDLADLLEVLVAEFEDETGVTVDESFIADIVSATITGKLYKGKWTLDKATKQIVDKYDRTVSSMYTNGKTSEDVLAVLNPNDSQYQHTVKTDEGILYVPKVGAATDTLMRTTLEHGYQEGIKQLADLLHEETHKEVMIRWLSALEWNTCEVCEGRHNELYRPEDLPLEHPNGQCEFCIEYA